ncbi:MAG: polyamine ABC transporter ATP-binding protein [Anaerolineaceae bacterium]|nr:polyamine ABC transporter ATP-binding protein [Anaerolineaceae bacterium]
MADFDVELINVVKEFPSARRDGAVRAVDDVSLQINDGEFFALLGPSGCGKTTTLRMIAGFEDTSSGQILIRGKAVQDVPPFHRPVNTVFQDYALFPHMTSLQNIMFGLEMEGVKRAEAKKRAEEALERVRLPQARDRRPRQLSGGQQQRVALARAIVKRPQVLLLDEPLSALDLKLREAMRYELKAMQRDLGITFIFVTHDQEEAMTMADRIAVMDRGKVLQVGTPEEIYEAPTTKFVADFIGETNFINGTFTDMAGQYALVKLDEQTTIRGVPAPDLTAPAACAVAIRPEKLNLFQSTGQVKFPDGSSDTAENYKAAVLKDPDVNMVTGKILQDIYIGTDTRYRIGIGADYKIEVIVRVQNYGLRSDKYYTKGDIVNVFWDSDNARLLSG